MNGNKENTNMPMKNTNEVIEEWGYLPSNLETPLKEPTCKAKTIEQLSHEKILQRHHDMIEG